MIYDHDCDLHYGCGNEYDQFRWNVCEDEYVFV